MKEASDGFYYATRLGNRTSYVKIGEKTSSAKRT
jgi:hypothetical protein